MMSDEVAAMVMTNEDIKVNGGKVLDVGCGSGRYIEFYQRHFRRPQAS